MKMSWVRWRQSSALRGSCLSAYPCQRGRQHPSIHRAPLKLRPASVPAHPRQSGVRRRAKLSPQAFTTKIANATLEMIPGVRVAKRKRIRAITKRRSLGLLAKKYIADESGIRTHALSDYGIMSP